MGGDDEERTPRMEPTSSCAFSILFLLIPFCSFISTATGRLIGVNYGRVADNLMRPEMVVELLRANNIGAVSIYDADQTVLQAFSGSGIRVTVTLPNQFLCQAATSTAFASDWVKNNVAAYLPSTLIHAIAVGNEISHCCSSLTPFLIPAMRNMADALAHQGLSSAVKVSTPVAFDAVTNSFPPSSGTFREDLQPVMKEMLELLGRTGSYLMINIYPYQAYIGDPNVPLDFALGHAQRAVVDPETGRSYYSMLDAQLDAVYSAMNRLGYGSSYASTMASGGGGGRKWVEVKETGWPHPPQREVLKRTVQEKTRLQLYKNNERTKSLTFTRKSLPGKNVAFNDTLLERSAAVTMENAAAYNENLIQRMLAGRTGTPLHPEAEMDVNIFALFDEDLKPGDPTEKNYGLFFPNGQKVYNFSFQPGGGTPTPVNPPERETWCVADGSVGRARLQAALDWACGMGNIDCRPIQPAGPCFEPNTVEAHATYAFNSYYQKEGRHPSACDFRGAAKAVIQAPSKSLISSCSIGVSNFIV